jgi:HAD superfamily hydrolase (TIGR01662 family)
MQEVVIIMGAPASGKSTLVKSYKNHARLNRDEQGGSINDLLPKLDTLLQSGKSVVMDNLFPTKLSRIGVIARAKKHKVPVKCVWLDTDLENSQFNACLRMIERTGKILGPKEKTNDPNLFPVAVIYKYRKEFEKPSKTEGFDSVEVVNFKREYPSDWINEAVIFDYDGTLRETKSGNKFPKYKEDVRILPNRKEIIQKLKGKILLGVSNQSGIAKGELTAERAIECFKETNRLLGVDIDFRFCPHSVPPISCYCRKPGPANGVDLILKYKLDPRKCIFVGDMGTDKTFAERCGFTFVDQEKFFK